MPVTVTVQEAETQLAELIGRLTPGEEIVITQNQNKPSASLFPMNAELEQCGNSRVSWRFVQIVSV